MAEAWSERRERMVNEQKSKHFGKSKQTASIHTKSLTFQKGEIQKGGG